MQRRERKNAPPDRKLKIKIPTGETFVAICRKHGVPDEMVDSFAESFGYTLAAAKQVQQDQMHYERPGEQREGFIKHARNIRDAANWVGRFDVVHPIGLDWQIVLPDCQHFGRRRFGAFPIHMARGGFQAIQAPTSGDNCRA